MIVVMYAMPSYWLTFEGCLHFHLRLDLFFSRHDDLSHIPFSGRVIGKLESLLA